MSAARPKEPRRSRRSVSRQRDPVRFAQDQECHARLIAEGKPMSGRCRRYVYYWAYGHLCWRLHVVPKDPRTPAQRRSRAAFGAASKAWSENSPLTEAQRNAWHAAAANIQSHPRLGLSGFRTGQQHFVGSNSVKERWGLDLLLEPAPRKPLIAESSQPQGVAQACADTPTAHTESSPPSPSPAKACAPQPIGRGPLSQLPLPHRFTLASSDRLHAASSPLPVQ